MSGTGHGARGVKDVFGEAVELPAGERPSFLERACEGDAVLRAEVERLLEAYDGAGALLDTPPAGGVAGLMGSTGNSTGGGAAARDAGEYETGARIGRYIVEKKLGEGGFADVYRALQAQPVRRVVALKVLKPGMDSRAVIRRFEAERQALAIMNHPSVARVYDAGTTMSGRPYFVMELVNGLPITRYCDERRLTIEARLELFRAVCEAVQHAHQKGLIHRDLKPSNILVSEIDGRGVPKVIDFGIAKALRPGGLVSGGANGGGDLTLPEQFIGTPLYMPPEQVSAADVDTRSDVYALGAVLYELLAGAPPVDPASLIGKGLVEMLVALRDARPLRPSARVTAMGDGADAIARARRTDTHRLWRALRGEIDRLVMRAIDREPGRRYSTAAAVGEDIRRYLRGEPLEAGPPTRSYRARKFVERHRALIGAGVLAVGALAVVAAGAVWFGLTQREVAQRLASERARSDAAAAFARGVLTGVDPASARGRDTALLREILAGASQRVHRELGEYPEAAVQMLDTIGYAYLRLGDMTKAAELFAAAAELGERTLGAEHERTLGARGNVAHALVEVGRFAEALGVLADLHGVQSRRLGADHAETQAVRLNLAMVHGRLHDLPRAAGHLQDLLELRERTLGRDHEDTLTVANNLAVVKGEMGESVEAVRLLRWIWDVQREKLGEDHPRALATAHNLGATLEGTGDTGGAAEVLRRVLGHKRRVMGEAHPSTLTTASTLAAALSKLGAAGEAEALFAESLAAARTGLPPTDLRLVSLLNGYGRLLVRAGRPAEAVPLAAEAAERIAQSLGSGHPQSLLVAKNHAETLELAGRLAEARAAAGAAYGVAAEALGPDHLTTAELACAVARVCAASGEPEEAERLLDAAIGACTQPDGEAVAKLRDALAALAASAR